MRTSFAAGLASLVLCFATQEVCRASILNPLDGFNAVKLYDGVGATGGIFRVDLNPSVGTTIDFDTFCVQTRETMSFSSKYTVYSVSKKTLGVLQNNVSLGSFAAWLYSGFRGLGTDMNLASFTTTNSATFSASNSTHVNALQAGIWRSMGYADSTFGFTVTSFMENMLTDWSTAFAADAVWAAKTPDSNGIITGNISIMNLVTMKYDGTTIKKHFQDQLVYIPPPPSGNPPVVPEPMSCLVWSMLAMCFGSLALRSRD